MITSHWSVNTFHISITGSIPSTFRIVNISHQVTAVYNNVTSSVNLRLHLAWDVFVPEGRQAIITLQGRHDNHAKALEELKSLSIKHSAKLSSILKKFS